MGAAGGSLINKGEGLSESIMEGLGFGRTHHGGERHNTAWSGEGEDDVVAHVAPESLECGSRQR